jgi:GNAT superfamily N-acetyltransferase
MSREVTIRDYRPEDADRLTELMRELQGELIPIYDRMLPLDRFAAWYRDEVLAECEAAKGKALIAEYDGRLVGYATVLVDVVADKRDEIAHSYALVGELLVTREARGEGVGARLLAECERVAREGGAKWLRIEALARNSGARRLYERCGFSDHFLQMEKPLGSSQIPD